jgi:hypothetical protein
MDGLCKQMQQHVRNHMTQDAEQKSDVPASAQLLPMIFGFMTSQAISIAAKLGVADLLVKGAQTADQFGANDRSQIATALSPPARTR